MNLKKNVFPKCISINQNNNQFFVFILGYIDYTCNYLFILFHEITLYTSTFNTLLFLPFIQLNVETIEKEVASSRDGQAA